MDQQRSTHHSLFLTASLIPLFLLILLISFLYMTWKLFLNPPVSPAQANQRLRTHLTSARTFFTTLSLALSCNDNTGSNDAVRSACSGYQCRQLLPGESVECAVCLSEVEDGEEVAELGCAHVFHKVCLERWVSSSGMRTTCPMCRRLIGFGRLAEEKDGEDGVILVRLSMRSSVSRRTRDRGDNFWLR